MSTIKFVYVVISAESEYLGDVETSLVFSTLLLKFEWRVWLYWTWWETWCFVMFRCMPHWRPMGWTRRGMSQKLLSISWLPSPKT